MKLFLPLLFLGCALQLSAQTPVNVNQTQPFGKIDIADLQLKACDFEPDANAMVLFEKADVYYDENFNIIMDVHRRVKIFNEHGKNEANIKLDFYGGNKLEDITGLQAETINLNGDKPEITKIDKKQIFLQSIDKLQNEYTFSFPSVKPGSVIEYKYRVTTQSYTRLPTWYFQSSIPVRYSEYDTSVPDMLDFKTQTHVNMPWALYKTDSQSGMIGGGADNATFTKEITKRALANVPSLPDEPYMTSNEDNLQSIHFQLQSIKPINGFIKEYSNTWAKIGDAVAEDEDFGVQLKRKLTNEEVIIAKAKTLKTRDEKISYIFNEVKNTLKWNEVNRWYTNDGTRTAWDKKTGNSTEINIILYHLLKQAGLDVYPMLTSTRSHGKVNPAYPFIYQFNRTVVYMPIDSTIHYIMDATDKYNMFNETPDNLLNSYGFLIDKDKHMYNLVFIEKEKPAMRSVYINAEISPEGQMNGTANISSISYSRINTIRSYKTDGEKKYIESLADHDNNLKISDLKMENLDVDSLPLAQHISFKLDLTGSDGTYIYFVPNLFSTLRTNPFLAENRHTTIDFGYRNNFAITGQYKIPAGYKIDALPKSISMVMPDKSISIRRLFSEEDGVITVRYVVDYKKSIYVMEDYPDLREFYKKMQELMSEQVVLKKS